MFYEYQTDTFILAVEQWLEQFRGRIIWPDNQLCIDHEHLFRQYETVLRAKTKPNKVLLSDYELELLQEFL
jgi:hypothetical protein